MSERPLRFSALASGVAVALGIAPQAVAQDDEEIEEIIVTGSYIRRSEYDSRAPLQIIDAERIELIGAERPAEVLNELTANSGSSHYNEIRGSGITQFSIRNLGHGSTLTLLNGKRAGVHPGGDPRTGETFLNINQFPLAMIERIEVLTDGASATYGSQAVAGVANIITRKGFEGLEISGGYSASATDSWHLNLAAGAAHDNGHFNIYATYYEQDHIVRSGFDWMVDRLDGQGITSRSRFLSNSGSPGSYWRAFLDPVTGEARNVPGANRTADPDCGAAGGVITDPADTGPRDFPNSCRYHFIDQVSVIHAETRAQVFTEFDWEFSNDVRYYLEASFSHNESRRDSGGTPFSNGRAQGGDVTILPSHPFNFFIEDPNDPEALLWIDPQNWDPAIHTAATLRMDARPLGADVTNTELTGQTVRDLDYFRVLNGFEIELPRDWYLDTSYAWAAAIDATNSPHIYRADIWQDLVRDGQWNPFGSRLTDPTLVSPKDGTSVAGNDPLVQDMFDAWNVFRGKSVQHVIDVVASGSAFEIADNTVSLAVGAQFRDLMIEQVPDSLSAAGEANDPGTDGLLRDNQQALAFFVEAIMPIGDFAEIQFAVRDEDYGDGVSTTDPKVSFELRPTDWLGFRGSWGTSFLAPTVFQTATLTGSAELEDPASPSGPNGELVCDGNGPTVPVVVTQRGAPDLTPQESVNYSLGVVLQFEQFRVSADYWNFDYEDLIASSPSARAILVNDCLDDGMPNDPRVVRSADGQVVEVFTQFENIGAVETDGIDVSADYTLEFGRSTMIFDFSGSYVFRFDVDRDGDGTLEYDGAGSRNFLNNFYTLPEFRGNAGATWFAGGHSAALTGRYIGGFRNDVSNDGKVKSWTSLDAQYSYTFDRLIGDGDTTLTVGVNNLLDEDPPMLTRNDANGNPLTRFREDGTYNRAWTDRPGYDDRAGHSLRGRIVYFRFKQSF